MSRSKRIGRSWLSSCAAACRTTRSGRSRTSTSCSSPSTTGRSRPADVALYADGVNVHAFLMPRDGVSKDGRGIRAQLVHAFVPRQRTASLYARSRRSPTCAPGCTNRSARHTTAAVEGRDECACRRCTRRTNGSFTRGDLDYTALWILYAATPLARIEVIGRGLLADREVIPQAMALNPAFFKTSTRIC